MRQSTSNLRVCTSAEAMPLQVSKWLKIQLLVEVDEMKQLLEVFGPMGIYCTSGTTPLGEGLISNEEFLECYAGYIASLKQGKVLEEAAFRRCFSSVFTNTPDVLGRVLVGETLQLIRPLKPVLQLQHHCIDYSTADGKFRSMVWGKNTVSWGIQFSYPQLYRDPVTCKIEKALDGALFSNAELFQRLQKWIRLHTAPTPFVFNGTKTNVPVRLGKGCFSWINKHPQLAGKGLSIDVKLGGEE